MKNLGAHIVETASAVFQHELRRELRAKMLALATEEIEHTIDEIIKGMNLRTTLREDQMHMRHEIEYTYRSV